jgi:hypothetical protein
VYHKVIFGIWYSLFSMIIEWNELDLLREHELYNNNKSQKERFYDLEDVIFLNVKYNRASTFRFIRFKLQHRYFTYYNVAIILIKILILMCMLTHRVIYLPLFKTRKPRKRFLMKN